MSCLPPVPLLSELVVLLCQLLFLVSFLGVSGDLMEDFTCVFCLADSAQAKCSTRPPENPKKARKKCEAQRGEQQ